MPEKSQVYEELYKCLEQLTLSQRLAIQMRFWEERTIEQIAVSLGISWSTADKLIEETLRSLKLKLNKTKKSFDLAAA